jgi:Domain of unknown function (DUF1996)
MRRWIILPFLALGAVPSAVASFDGAGPRGGGRDFSPPYPRAGYFAVACGFSHRNQDDPIIHPRHRGRSHDHTYFGNTLTNAFSTPASLRAAGRTTCRLPDDTAAYWAPTLFVGGRAVEPLGVVAQYVRRTFASVQPFPAGLKVVAGDAAARSPQSRRVTNWSCGRGGAATSAVPTCSPRWHSGLRLTVNFPNCWDGRRLDSADHKSHMAYSSNGRCAASHPEEVPGLSLVIYYGVAGGSTAELASGGDFSGHADFVNAWDQRTLAALVDRYLNGFRHRGRTSGEKG